MKKARRMKWSTIVLSALFFLSGCSVFGSDSNWEYEGEIEKPITAVAGDEEVVLGDLETHQVQITLPKGVFSEPTEVTLVNPEEA
ncbi:MAG TPA: hypothetical protein DHN33_04675, partial [Eubacteriaceae bacterium]|nr:hypothetical protein [Eubacteriaceae bacterium]